MPNQGATTRAPPTSSEQRPPLSEVTPAPLPALSHQPGQHHTPEQLGSTFPFNLTSFVKDKVSHEDLSAFREDVEQHIEVRKFAKLILFEKYVFGELSQEFFSQQRALIDLKDAQWEARHQREIEQQTRHHQDLKQQVQEVQEEASNNFNQLEHAAQLNREHTTERLQSLTQAQAEYSTTQKQLLDDIAILKDLKTTFEQEEFVTQQTFQRLWTTQDLENQRNDEAFDLLLKIVQGLQRHQDFQVV